ncbi:MAG: ABC transporter substrate-binding protein [candidate division Zixibacteria bacterium]|nr:ABC transporter substrate-binding protein [candidate division Zixibacteria bacterium]
MNLIKKLSLVIIIFFLLCHNLFAYEKTIVIVKSSSSTPFLKAVEGFKKEIRKSEIEAILIEYDVSDQSKGEGQIAQKIRNLKPDLIVTIGSRSTAMVSQKIKDIPIVFCMVLNPVSSGFIQSMRSSGNNLSGASLDIPVRIQLEKFKLIVPKLKRLGVLFTQDSKQVIIEAQGVCKRIGVELVPELIYSEKEIPGAVEALAQEVDGLWAVADTIIFTPQSTQHILLYTLRNGLPFMGLSPSFVKAGALFTLACDHKDVGRQAGELALGVLSGEVPSQIPITIPRMIYLCLNLRTAEQINLKIPEKIVSVAKEVFK